MGEVEMGRASGQATEYLFAAVVGKLRWATGRPILNCAREDRDVEMLREASDHIRPLRSEFLLEAIASRCPLAQLGHKAPLPRKLSEISK